MLACDRPHEGSRLILVLLAIKRLNYEYYFQSDTLDPPWTFTLEGWEVLPIIQCRIQAIHSDYENRFGGFS